MLADLDAGAADRLAYAVADALGLWMARDGIPHRLVAADRVRTLRAAGYLPGTRPEVLAARLGTLLPRDDDGAAVQFVAAGQVAQLRGHQCRRVNGRAVVDGVPVVVTMEARGLRVEIVATVVVSQSNMSGP